MTLPILHVNVDHIATLRQARRTIEPDPVYGALVAEQAGARGITVHLREDRRHIQDRDVEVLRQVVQTKLNLEMAGTDEMVKKALSVRPEICTLVPEKREEVTTEGGLNLLGQMEHLSEVIARLQGVGIRVSLFIDPVDAQIEAAKTLKADDIELHTGEYAHAKELEGRAFQLKRLQEGARLGQELGLQVNAGHGLTYFNVGPVAKIVGLKELNIGHSIIARSVYVGMAAAVREMIALIGAP
ncbi:MAG: pyridoxine 5'-phosphate synthase [Candidatus Lambdaproteobacteria bacterium RIFOXYD1_FULL_56_27]|uniref:Pyridoxine 5'-phosphate synthase n=1 Tax=Candidatus Lambdaproteobacteria bacterium RIFOXYD2_FULL_56_26 TaxID=1817773 RepID=A0A1F6GVE2_9PROT|nr:MAG: pyridoxine 5'-phosphate synthase [Candidatus Lambdaproteobacteria bacterium RIFOXYD2_FULL_56_26]OGH07479.1 MAG: pyridoxine 5'-phosphate synthase [Candidatus Lambdaproteobacteria bacterium RIFOXYD1_FULL_56_27]